LFMTPIGWTWALAVWGYALVWFLINDRIKLVAYRLFHPANEPVLDKMKKLREA
jgi:H+-transporting ATPase